MTAGATILRPLAMEKKTNNGLAARLWRRLEGRARLLILAAESQPASEEERQLQRLRAYLYEWSVWELKWRPADRMGAVPYLDEMRPSYPMSVDEEAVNDINLVAVRQIDAAILDLSVLPDGLLMRAALRARYLNEGVSRAAGFAVRVFRHKRLEALSIAEADAMADRAEHELIPILKRRDVPL